MSPGEGFLYGFIVVLLIKGNVGALEVHVAPRYVIANPGEEVSFLCKVNAQLQICMFQVGSEKNKLLNPDQERSEMMYSGKGLDNGECGVRIQRVDEKHNGNVTCSFVPKTEQDVHKGNMHLVVAVKPKSILLDVSVKKEGTHNNYKESDVLSAMCTVGVGRPAANISWYLGDDVITEMLTEPLITCPGNKRVMCAIQQNLTRILQATDDKKILKCVASHHSLKDQELKDEYTINVNYPPRPPTHAFEHFGLVEGAMGRVPITIEANPKPLITWSIGGDHVIENTNNGRYTVQPTVPKGPGKFETVLLIDTLTKEDTTKEYKVTAHNDFGEEQYTVSISTSQNPKVLELGTGLIIFIVVSIILILVILGGVMFARAKGKFCSVVTDAEKRVSSPSEGTENPAVNHHASTEYIKEKPKEDTPV